MAAAIAAAMACCPSVVGCIAPVVIPDEPGHSMCAPVQDRWVDHTGLRTGAVPVHPTSAGQAHVAQRVLSVLGG